MKYPDCKGDGCRFVEEGGRVTLMYSPIHYDVAGNPIGGGGNYVTRVVRCVAHNEYFESKQTELADAQGKDRTWGKISELTSDLLKIKT